MKKYINKLFERLGYVPKRYKALQEEGEFFINQHRECALECFNYFTVERRYEKDKRIGYVVIQHSIVHPQCWIVKFFPDDGAKDYARICAEELCDMLNERY